MNRVTTNAFSSRTIFKADNAGVLGAVGATEDGAVLFDAMPDDFAAAMLTDGCKTKSAGPQSRHR